MPHARTVSELRKFLDELELNWDQESVQYLGKFEDQPVLVPYFEQVPASNRLECRGYGPAAIAYDPTGLGILIDEPAYH